MNKTFLSIVGVIIVIAIAFFAFGGYLPNEINVTPSNELPSEVVAHIESKSDLIVLHNPEPMALVSSPLSISGEARGFWFFEADFPVRIEDENGNILGQHFATAALDPNDPESTWMTEDFVPFTSNLSFSQSTTEYGNLILERDNPSGLPENHDELRIPVQFTATGESTTPPATQSINLYYYNPSLDEDDAGNIMCSEAGLVSVERNIPATQTPIQDAINLLITGKLTSSEESQGITTEYPLPGFSLVGASLNNGILTLEFNDPNNATTGGSCRVGILWMQIKNTAEQFDAVNEVHFRPEELFQP